MIPPSEEQIEKLAILMALAKEGRPEWPPHLSNVECDVYRVKAMEFLSLLRKVW